MSNNIVQLKEEIIKGQLKELVRSSVEEPPERAAGKRGGVVDAGGPLRA